MTVRFRPLILLTIALLPTLTFADSLSVRRKQQPMHQQFVIKTADGKVIGSGEEVSTAQGAVVRSDLVFHFLDGSLDEQITTFTQDKVFHLINDHHVQKGPSFPIPLDMTVDVPSRTVTWHQQKGGRDQAMSQHMDMPADLANGLVPLLAENVPAGGLRASWLAVAIKPLLVTLTLQPDAVALPRGTAEMQHAQRYLLHVELHGLASLVAPLISKQPADLHFWVTDAPLPSFLQLEGPFYQGGPDWIVQSTGPEVPPAVP